MSFDAGTGMWAGKGRRREPVRTLSEDEGCQVIAEGLGERSGKY
jgi:hypothetical protein